MKTKKKKLNMNQHDRTGFGKISFSVSFIHAMHNTYNHTLCTRHT